MNKAKLLQTFCDGIISEVNEMYPTEICELSFDGETFRIVHNNEYHDVDDGICECESCNNATNHEIIMMYDESLVAVVKKIVDYAVANFTEREIKEKEFPYHIYHNTTGSGVGFWSEEEMYGQTHSENLSRICESIYMV